MMRWKLPLEFLGTRINAPSAITIRLSGGRRMIITASFFNRVERKRTGENDETVILSGTAGEVTHPAQQKR